MSAVGWWESAGAALRTAPGALAWRGGSESEDSAHEGPDVAVLRAGADARPGWVALMVLVGYLAMVVLGDHLRDVTSGVSLLWLPNAVLVSALVLSPRRRWPGILAAGLAAELLADALIGIPVPAAVGLGLVNIGEAALVGLLVVGSDNSRWPLQSVRSVLVVATATVGVTALTAVAGALVARRAFGGSLGESYASWWLGDSVGILVGVPTVIMAVGLVAGRAPGAVWRAGLALGVGIVGVILGGALGAVTTPASAGFVMVAVANAMALVAGADGAALGGLAIAVVTVIALRLEGVETPVSAQLAIAPLIVAVLLIGAQVSTMARQQAALAAANARIADLALTDELTGLANLRGLRLRAAQELARASRAGLGAGLLYADVNGLKGVNDRHGHALGSAALADVATILRSCFRVSDALGRVGGDEFVVVFSGDGPGVVDEARERVHEALATVAAPPGVPRLALSIGTAWASAEQVSGTAAEILLAELMDRADAVMYREKHRRGP